MERRAWWLWGVGVLGLGGLGCAPVPVGDRAPAPRAVLTWFDRGGERLNAVPGSEAGYVDIWLDRDEQSVVAATRDRRGEEYWRIDLQSGTRRALRVPAPDRTGGRVRRLTTFSNDVLVHDIDSPAGDSDIWLSAVDGGQTPRAYLSTPVDERGGRLSNERRWMAYETNESGTNEIYLRTFPDAADRWLLASGGVHRPVWRSDSIEIYHWAAGRLMVTPLKRGDRFILPGNAATLFTIDAAAAAPPFVVTRDGRRILVAMPAGQ